MAELILVSASEEGRAAAQWWRKQLAPYADQLHVQHLDRNSAGAGPIGFLQLLRRMLGGAGVGSYALATDRPSMWSLILLRMIGSFVSLWHPGASLGCFVLIRFWPETTRPRPRLGGRSVYVHRVDMNLFASPAAMETLVRGHESGRVALGTPAAIVADSETPRPGSIRLGEFVTLLVGQTEPAPDWRGIELSYVTHFYVNQESVGAVIELARRYASYAPDVLDRVLFVFIDDGSPLVYDIPKLDINMLWLKITDDIPWNMAGARNLGVTMAKSERVLLTDVDVEFPESSLRALCHQRLARHRIGTINDYDPSSGELLDRGHPNAYLIARSCYLETGGCEEGFAGAYGCEDTYFPYRLRYLGLTEQRLPKSIRCFARADIDRETDYHALEREHTRNRIIECLRRRDDQWYGIPWGGHSKVFLNFSWRVLQAHSRKQRASRRPLRRNWMRMRIPRILATWLRG